MSKVQSDELCMQGKKEVGICGLIVPLCCNILVHQHTIKHTSPANVCEWFLSRYDFISWWEHQIQTKLSLVSHTNSFKFQIIRDWKQSGENLLLNHYQY